MKYDVIRHGFNIEYISKWLIKHPALTAAFTLDYLKNIKQHIESNTKEKLMKKIYDNDKDVANQMNINLLIGTREKEIFKNKQIYSELVSNNFKEANKNQYNKFNIKCASSQAIRVQSSNNGLKRKRDPNDLFNLFGDTEEPDYDEELKEKLTKRMNNKD